MRKGLLVPVILVLLLLGCSQEAATRDPSAAVAEFFQTQGPVGSSPDVGLYQGSQYRPGEYDHVATIHGLGNDRSFCEELVELLKRDSSGYDYECRPLNSSRD